MQILNSAALNIPTQPSTSTGTWGSLAQMRVIIFHWPFPHTLSSPGMRMETRGAHFHTRNSISHPLATALANTGAAGWVPDFVCTTQQGEAEQEASHRGHSKALQGTSHNHGRGSAACGASSILQQRHIRCSLQYLFNCRAKEGKGEYWKKENRRVK